jgi:hypothetical protein
MKASRISLWALTASAAAATTLVGCGGSQPPIAAPGTMVQSRAITAQADHAGLQTLPYRSRPVHTDYQATGPLIFVVNFTINDVTVYPAKANNPSPIATITQELFEPIGDCIDRDGTLYVASNPPSSLGWVSEYALGKTQPLRVITNGISSPLFCAIDSRGSLWVTNLGGTVTEYLKGSTSPHMTLTQGLKYPEGIAIDRSGNIYIGNYITPTACNANIKVFSPGTKSPSRTITDGVVCPAGIAVDATSTLYVPNNGVPYGAPCNVEEYRAGESYPYKTLTTDLYGPDALTFAKDGLLYVSDWPTLNCAPSRFSPPEILEFRAGSVKPLGRGIKKDLAGNEGVAYYPPLLP